MSNNKENQKIDYGIILTVMLLALISISMIYSTTALMGGAGLAPTIMQAVWYGLGAIAVCVIMQFDSEQLWKMTTYLYIGGILLLILTSLFYDRNLETATGARSWIRLGPIGTIQPSEFVKIPYILMLARLVTRHNSHYQNRDYASDFKLIGKLALFSAIPTALVLLQNDLGTTLVYLAIFVYMYLNLYIKYMANQGNLYPPDFSGSNLAAEKQAPRYVKGYESLSMTNNTCVNKKKAYFLNHTKFRFSQKKGLIFKESLIEKKKVSKQNSFLKTHP